MADSTQEKEKVVQLWEKSVDRIFEDTFTTSYPSNIEMLCNNQAEYDFWINFIKDKFPLLLDKFEIDKEVKEPLMLVINTGTSESETPQYEFSDPRTYQQNINVDRNNRWLSDINYRWCYFSDLRIRKVENYAPKPELLDIKFDDTEIEIYKNNLLK